MTPCDIRQIGGAAGAAGTAPRARNASIRRGERCLRSALLGLSLTLVAPAWAAGAAVQVIHGFDDETAQEGREPVARLVEHQGAFYGSTFAGGDDNCGTLFRITPESDFERLHSLVGGLDGCNTPAALAPGADGALYGVARLSGPGNMGTVYRLDTDGAFTRLHAFGLPDGSTPIGGLVAAGDGNLYGTISGVGGVNRLGAVFRVTGDGDVEQIYSLLPGDFGISPRAALVEGPDGALYGSTQGGGDDCEPCGTLFRITTTGEYRTLHRFGADGEVPVGPLVFGADGLLYGVTELGGEHGQGMVFRIPGDGDGLAVVHSFDGAADGVAVPTGGLTAGADGALYGTTARGVFRVEEDTVTILVTHAALLPSGLSGLNGVVQGSDGHLYGTARFGGEHRCETAAQGCGAVFRVMMDDSDDGDDGGDGDGDGSGNGDAVTGGSSGGGGGVAPGALGMLLGLAGLRGWRRRTAVPGRV